MALDKHVLGPTASCNMSHLGSNRFFSFILGSAESDHQWSDEAIHIHKNG